MSVGATAERFGNRSREILDAVFLRAKASDEFEYVCSLLRIRGLEDPGWDPLSETNYLFRDLTGLIEIGLADITRLRITLLTYCHLVEAKAIYQVIENMLRTIEGERCSISPFGHLHRESKKGRLIPPSTSWIVTYLRGHAKQLDLSDLTDVLGLMFNDTIRNSFFHSDYIIYNGKYRTRDGMFKIDGRKTSSIDIGALIDILNRGLAFYQAFMRCFLEHKFSYKENKQVVGRMGRDNKEIPVTILADTENGLHGISG